MREEPDGAVLINLESNTYFLASPFEAFVLSFFDGTKTIEYISDIFKSLKNASEEKEIQNDLLSFVQKKSEFIEIINIPLEKSRNQVNTFATFVVDII